MFGLVGTIICFVMFSIMTQGFMYSNVMYLYRKGQPYPIILIVF